MKRIVEFEGERDEDGVRNEVGSPAQEHLEMVGVTEIQDEQPLPEPKKEVESLCRPVNNDDIVVFPWLERVTLRRLPKLKSFYTETQGFFSHKVIFPVLERLSIYDLGNIIKIWDKQLVAVWQEQGSFCQLTYVNIEKCEKLMHVFPSNMHPLLKNLEELKVEECETMKGIFEFEGERDEDGVRNEIVSPAREHLEMVGVIEIEDKQPLPESRKEVESLCRPLNNDDIIVFPRLKTVTLNRLPKLKSFYSETQGIFSHKVAFPVLKRLFFWRLDKITRIWDNQPLSELEKKDKSFCQLMKIDVCYCNQLEYVLPSYMLPQLENLEELHIYQCWKMEVIISNNPQEKEATNNNDTIRFPQLKTLQLGGLPNLKSFICSDETQLFFSNKVAKSFCQLMKIFIYDCNQLEYVLPSYMFPQLENLEELYIGQCTKMEVIISNNPQEKEATNNNDTIRFPQLKKVKLHDLPNFKSFICSDETQLFFSNKVAFPVLEHLEFCNLDKITRIWDNQPLSEPEKEAKFFSKLEIIYVERCEHLEYVLPFYMLPQLKKLQDLRIRDCTRVEVIISNNSREKEATNNNDTIRFPQLKTLQLGVLPNLKSFICSDETQLLFSNKVIFPVLKKLSIRRMNKIIEIWDKQSIAVLEEEGSFCQLTDLDVSECEKLMHVFPSKMHSLLKNLTELSVSDCPTMEGIVEFEGEIDEDGLRNEVCFSEMRYLALSNLPNLESFRTKLGKADTTLFNEKVTFPVLETLKFKDLHKITRIWDNQLLSEREQEAKSFCKLKKINVEDCDQLEYVLPLPLLKNLKELYIARCRRMEVIISNNPKEKEAADNNHTIRFPQLNVLILEGLPNLKSFICSETQLFFSNKDVFPVLKNIILRPEGTLEFLRNETSTKEVSIEECSTSGKESGHNGEELDEDLKTPAKEVSKEECGTSGKENDHNGEGLDEDLETPMKKVSTEECGTSGPSGKENDHN